MKLAARCASPAFVALLAIAGCGTANDSKLSDSARARIVPLVGQVRSAAQAHDLARTRNALTALVEAVNASTKAGEIGATKAAEILDAATEVQSRLALVPTTVAATTTTTTTEPDDNGKGNGKGKNGDHGNKGGD